jgi:hypothetical protein
MIIHIVEIYRNGILYTAQVIYDTLCCKDMKECDYIQMYRDKLFIGGKDKWGDLEEDRPINYCPFCGVKIEYVVDGVKRYVSRDVVKEVMFKKHEREWVEESP